MVIDIEKFLQKAEEEYRLNGRSERFVSMENGVLASQDNLLIIEFSKLKGARIRSIAIAVGSEMLDNELSL